MPASQRNIQWFPGHMAKTRRMITENLKNVDAVVELLDARIPLSSRNPEISKLTARKLNKVVDIVWLDFRLVRGFISMDLTAL
jgi:ribosome biogenesis GTPase A